MPAKAPRLTRVQLSSADPARLVAFYRDTLGLPLKSVGDQAWQCRLGELDLVIGAGESPVASAMTLTLEVPDVEAVAEKMGREPEELATVTDPDGNRIALVHAGQPARKTARKTDSGAQPPSRKTIGKRQRDIPAPSSRSPKKTLGRRVVDEVVRAASEPADLVRAPEPKISAPSKTLGRAARGDLSSPATNFLSRALVRQKIADRLAGKITASALATWARAQWLEVQRGAPAESGQRELLEDALQSLLLSTLPPSRLSDDQLVELMTQLGT